MIPDIEPLNDSLPQGALNLGDQYYLLYAMDSTQREVTELEKEAFKFYLESTSHLPPRNFPVTKVTCWAHLHLPNCQTARSFWKEGQKPIKKLRCSRNVKVNTANQ